MKKENIPLLFLMPLYYNGLVVEISNKCNAKCDICYQSAGPSGSEESGLAEMNTDTIFRCIREAVQIETVAPRFHLSGGEAFINPKQCLSIFQEAKNVGFEDITATTNCFWGKSPRKALYLCEKMRDAGVTSLELSYDYWHKSYVSPEAMSNCIEACAVTEIETNLRILTTKNHNADEIISYLCPGSLDKVSKITICPVLSLGRAEKMINSEEFIRSPQTLNSECYGVLNLTINSLGNVFPCCAGLDQTKNYAIGNVNSEPLRAIVERMNCDPIIRRIAFMGIHSLIPILKSDTFQIESYHNRCHLCCAVFSNSKYVKVLQDTFEERKKNAILKGIERMEKSKSNTWEKENAL